MVSDLAHTPLAEEGEYLFLWKTDGEHGFSLSRNGDLFREFET